MQPYQKILREGLFPILSPEGLDALKTAIETDDPAFIQGATTVPPPLACVSDWPVEGACLIAYPYWKGDGLNLIGEVEEAFARTAFEVEQKMGYPVAVRDLLDWFDSTARDEMRRLLLAEVNFAIADRNTLEMTEAVRPME